MQTADLEQFRNRCLDRATRTTRGKLVDLSIDVGPDRVLLGFDQVTRSVKAATVAPRPAHSPQRVSVTEPDDSDDEPAKSVWEEAGEFIDDVESLGAAIYSKWREGPVIGAPLDFRVQCCFGKTMAGIEVNKPCPQLVAKDGNSYCGGCRCGTRKRAQLNPRRDGDWTTSKLAYPAVPCALDHFRRVAGSKLTQELATA